MKNRAIVVLLCVVQVGVQAAMLGGGPDFVSSKMAYDDTFYYLVPALNLWRDGSVTFDGVNRTNGVQFAWFAVVAALAAVQDRMALLYLALAACAALNAASYILIWRVTRGTWAAVAASTAWFFLNTRTTFYISGKENSLHAFLFCLALALIVERRSTTAVAIVSALAVMTRLDSAVFMAPLCVYAWQRNGRRMADLAALGGVSIVSAAVTLGGYYWMAGTLLPVSGMVKLGALANVRVDFYLRGLIRIARYVFPLEVWRLVWPGAFFPAMSGLGVNLLLLGASVPAAVIVCRKVKRDDEAEMWMGRGLALVLAVSTLIYNVFYTQSHVHASYAIWYESPSFIACILLACMAAGWVKRINGRALATGLLALTLAVAGSTAIEFRAGAARGGARNARLQAAEWMDEQEGAKFGSWNAGLLGFASTRPVTNLDGLINSPGYWRDVLRASDVGSATLGYLERAGIGYVVDMEGYIPGYIEARWQRVTSFRDGEGMVIVVYRMERGDRDRDRDGEGICVR